MRYYRQDRGERIDFSPSSPVSEPHRASKREWKVLMMTRVRILAAGCCDGAGFAAAPAELLLEVESTAESRFGRVTLLAAGSTSEVASRARGLALDLASFATVEMPQSVILPALVNAHTHLDLTHIGPRPELGAGTEAGAGGPFADFAALVRDRRLADDADIAASVQRGIELSIEGGVVAIGDIAGSVAGGTPLTPWRTLAASGLQGVSFLEFFAIGPRERASLERIERTLAVAHDEARATRGSDRVRIGIQPHAPYSVSLAGYERANRLANAIDPRVPLCTHIAESGDERELISRGTGPLRTFLERVGAWDDSCSREFGQGRSPVQHLLQGRELRPVCVHVNDASDPDLELMASRGLAVVYCPRSSAYFGAPARFGPHRWKDMLARGIDVALGTDSIINLPGDAARHGSGAFSTLGEMRHLWRTAARPGPDEAVTLLKMATLNGAKLLGLEQSAWRLAGNNPSGGRVIAGLIAVDVSGTVPVRSPAERVLDSTAAPEFLFASKKSPMAR
ncbi:MAG: amidohydrolase family protein [Planctomycetota bacterium]|nr:amidohydrolase family protein [Planctomycetota bacterium]